MDDFVPSRALPISSQNVASHSKAALIQACLLGCVINILGYGFSYGHENHPFELAMLNFMRDPSLYPGDPIRVAFAKFPTVFWRIVALVPQRLIATEHLLFLFFILTKVLFFLGLVRILFCLKPDVRFVQIMVVVVALSRLLNMPGPFGGARLLDPTQTHTPLAIALLVCASASLLKGKWILATFLTAMSVYLSAIYVVYVFFAFALIAIADWKLKKRVILGSALLGAIFVAPWLVLYRDDLFLPFPKNYVSALLLFYPAHLTVQVHTISALLYGVSFLLLALGAVIWARKTGLETNLRLQLLALGLVMPTACGIVVGEFFLTPRFARLQLLRADSFLFFFAILLLGISLYTLAITRRSSFALLVIFVAAFMLLVTLSPMRISLVAVSIPLILRRELYAGFVLFRGRPENSRAWSQVIPKVLVVTLSVIYASLIVWAIRAPSTRALFAYSQLDPWSSLQNWARLNTAPDAEFLVPTDCEGFRVLSQRSSWGEWKDGQAVFLYPPFAAIYIQRMHSVGIYKAPSAPEWMGGLRSNYENLPWENLLGVAVQNHLQYIVQHRPIRYPAPVAYENEEYTVYKVAQPGS
jgi:hypothetical protein